MDRFAKLCRLCLSPEQEVSLFSDLDYSNRKFYEVVISFANVQFSVTDGLPHMICKMCASHLTNIDLFRQKCEMSQRKLLMESLSLAKSVPQQESQTLDPLLLGSQLGGELLEEDAQTKPLYEATYSESSSTNYQLESGEVKIKSEEVEASKRVRQKSNPTLRVRPKRYKCMQCNKSVESPSKLVRHMRTHEIQTHIIDSHRLYTCNYCTIRFRKVKDMRTHIKACSQAHGQDFQKLLKAKPPAAGPPKCDYCDLQFNSDVELNHHVESFHADQRGGGQQ
ncbi:zinc finger protein 184-like [Phlebotomus argentipes]|uniref:zinc finger protein 184-like n=1 Tax=Phlebotomus argentipes TaxID=94469 RepID=UPI0028932C6C|nr:zinc finger protein 184-like [Phlebotomus argentipes]